MSLRDDVREGLSSAAPIFIGYLSASLAFGFLSSGAGLSLLEACLFSLITFTGAAQFMAIKLISEGSSPQIIVISYFLVNLRYFLMSSSLVQRVRFSHHVQRFLLAFGVTDESFSVASLKKGEVSPAYLFALEILPWIGWNLGTLLGFIFGSILPSTLQLAMEGSLYALFAALLVPEIKKGWRPVAIIASAAGINTLLTFFSNLSTGWNFVIAMLSATVLGTVLEIRFSQPEAAGE